jgi:hypothetical protein
MKVRILGLLAGVALMWTPTASAQDTPATFVMGTYYRCTQGDSARADAIFKEQFEPYYKAEQAAGHITSYGWAQHAEGGDWRRLMYAVGTDLAKLSESRAALVKQLGTPEHVKAFEEFGRICGSHDDYIWKSVATSQAPDAVARVRSPYGMSTYYICTAAEDEADAIVKAAYAPVLNERVKSGAISSWNWMEHQFGGVYRRVLVMDGADETALLKNWSTLADTVEKASPAFARRFGEICDRHTDYIWQFGAK